jgi:hypothetical protein
MTIATLIASCASMMRKGEEIVAADGPVRVVHVYALPHESSAGAGVEKVDVHFVIVAVDRKKAEDIRSELIEAIDRGDAGDLSQGPSYIAVGADLDGQSLALKLFAVGQVLGLWTIMTPADFGITGEEADRMAGAGFVMISGYRKASR